MVERIGKHHSLMEQAISASKRATCPRGQSGCVVAKNGVVITTAYNGSVEGESHCDEIGCDVQNNTCVRSIHAEINAIINAHIIGASVYNADWYITKTPCNNCAPVIRRLKPTSIHVINRKNTHKDYGPIQKKWAEWAASKGISFCVYEEEEFNML